MNELPGICGHCGYDVQDIPAEAMCPECGGRLRLTVTQARRLRHWKQTIALGLCGVSLIALILSLSGPDLYGLSERDGRVAFAAIVGLAYASIVNALYRFLWPLQRLGWCIGVGTALTCAVMLVWVCAWKFGVKLP